jgi:hypothetical protein
VHQEGRRDHLGGVDSLRGDVSQVVYEPDPAYTAGPTALFSQDHAQTLALFWVRVISQAACSISISVICRK